MINATENMHFSEDLAKRLEESMRVINNVTLITNQKIAEIYQRSDKLDPDLYDLATIISAQHTVLDEKYKVLHALVTDLYSRFETLQENPHV